MWEAPFDAVDFKEAILWFRKRVPIKDGAFAKLTTAATEQGFRVAGLAQLDLVTDVWKALDEAVSKGTTLDEFKKSVGARLATAWAGDSPTRLETIFRTNVQLAYSAGRYEQMTDPAVLEDRPYWYFDNVADSRQSNVCREIVAKLEGKALPADDPWWATHVPPLHFNCRSAITTLSAEQAGEMGIAKGGPKVKADGRFGVAPKPGDVYDPDPKKYPEPLWNAKEV